MQENLSVNAVPTMAPSNTYVISGGKGYQNLCVVLFVALACILSPRCDADGVSASAGGGIAAVDAPADQQFVPFAQHDLS